MKHSIDTSSVLFFKSLKNINDISLDYSIKIYYRNGNEVAIDHGACLNPSNLSISTDSTYGFVKAKEDTAIKISGLSRIMYFSDNKNAHLLDTAAKYDLTMIVPFATWVKGPTKNNLKDVASYLKGLTNKKVKVLYADLDLLNSMVPADSVDYYKKHTNYDINYTAD